MKIKEYIKNKYNNLKFKVGQKREYLKRYRMISKDFRKIAKNTDKETAKYWKELMKKISNEVLVREHKTQYDYWVDQNDFNLINIKTQQNHKFEYNPKISILTPLYNTNTKFFRDLLFYLEKQTYSNWELCLADGSPKPLIDIQKMIKNEPRIKYKYLNKNGGISENTNEALKLATGDFIALMDHDDTISMDCLFENVKVINENPDVEFLFSDEDKMYEVADKRFDPHFKPDFAIDTLRCENYICHFSVFKKEVMDKLEGERSEYDGAQDFDIILRMTEVVDHKNIIHIPKVLYHWRLSETSTAANEEAKPYAYIAGEKAVQDHLNRLGLNAKATRSKYYGLYDTFYEVNGNPKVNILIPNKDEKEILEKCVNSILEKTNYENYEIDIIENNSESEKIFEYYKELENNPRIKVLKYEENGFNYSKLINFGVKSTDGQFVFQLNNDTEVIEPNWLKNMLGICQREDVGIVGAKLLYPDDTIQHAGIILGMLTLAGHIHKGLRDVDLGFFARAVIRQDVTAVTGACLLAKRSIYEEVGYMNEDLAVAFNDIDFCLKARKKGYLVVYEPTAKLYHYESKSRGYDEFQENKERFERFSKEVALFKSIWGRELEEGDPYYNKNLNLDDVNCLVRTDKINY